MLSLRLAPRRKLARWSLVLGALLAVSLATVKVVENRLVEWKRVSREETCIHTPVHFKNLHVQNCLYVHDGSVIASLALLHVSCAPPSPHSGSAGTPPTRCAASPTAATTGRPPARAGAGAGAPPTPPPPTPPPPSSCPTGTGS